MKILGVIPARWASTRLPGKPLADIGGKPMIQHVYERAKRSPALAAVTVATDDPRVLEAVRAFGGEAVMTSPQHPNGTSRAEEAARAYPWAEAVINIQGDEPLLDPAMVDAVAQALAEPGVVCATLCCPLPEKEAANPNRVKVVLSQAGDALYFSRAPIPYPRNTPALPLYLHIGIYGYTRDFLRRYVELPATPLAEAESLEQLKALEHGYKIRVKVTAHAAPGVDTPEDLELARQALRAGTSPSAPATPNP